MKASRYFLLVLLVSLFACESNKETIVHRRKSGIIAEGQQINMLYTEPSEYIKLINDSPLFAICVFDTKTDYGEDYIKVFNHLTPLLEEEYGFVPELVVDFCGHTIFTPSQHTYYNWGDDIYVDQILPLEDYFYDVYLYGAIIRICI